MLKSTNLNFLTLPLQGTSLIEASAGTGKTYTLSLIYLRLLLGISGNIAFTRKLSVREILVVTFTETATEELRNRIRKNIHELRLACIRGKTQDSILRTLMIEIDNYEIAASQLLIAERNMNEAAIFTIHSFCQRILKYITIESGLLFQSSLLEDETLILKQICNDFWRRYCYPLPLNIARIVWKQWKGPEELLTNLLPYLHGDLPLIYDTLNLNESIHSRYIHIITTINNLKQQWIEISNKLLTILNGYKLNRKIYNRRNLLSWFIKIDFWAKQTTIDEQVPNELKRFTSAVLIKNTISGDPPDHSFFITLQNFYKNKSSICNLIFATALIEIRQTLKQEKQKNAEMSFDDLLSYVDTTLSNKYGEELAESIRLRYPFAIIDEFQDTDQKQYRIFRQIYYNKSCCALLLIGDPKQAIYAFRGANVFTYMQARREINVRYTLDTNWRSAPGMINAVNKIFQNLSAPFIFKDISFLPIFASKSNKNLQFIVQKKIQPALRIWLKTGLCISISEYKKYMAQQCAITIRDWLYASQIGEAWLENNKGRRLLRASDITVLVRNRDEAIIISDALSVLNIPTVYLSNQKNVFSTLEARELLMILQAVLKPESDTIMRTALATSLLGFHASTLDVLNSDTIHWEQLVEEFTNYYKQWQKKGILSMLQQLIIKHNIAENLLSSNNGDRKLTNLLHLGELLQEASIQMGSGYMLICWLTQQIASPNSQALNQRLRLENDHHLVQIITVHKSKGQEFPLVLLPFMVDFRVQKRPLFHNRNTFKECLDLCNSQESICLAEEERLSEDLRLLYVAITRSIYHCSLGIAPLYHGNSKKKGISDLHLSGLGYLIQKGQEGNTEYLQTCLKKLVNQANGDITLHEVKDIAQALPLASNNIAKQTLEARYCPKIIQDSWHITSYSELQQYNSQKEEEPSLLPCNDWDINDVNYRQEKSLQLTPHTFPRGLLAGKFLHEILETLNFKKSIDTSWLSRKLLQKGIDIVWLQVIIDWMRKIFTMSLNKTSLSLANLTNDIMRSEFKFYLSINTLVKASDLDQICKNYDSLSARCKSLNFSEINGMIKGFIDLIFYWDGRYYLLDYKSNWLGMKSADYTQASMEKAMIEHRYDLQYQLYTLAFHRYLRHRLSDYNYSKHFGGVYYFFLRGVNTELTGNCILYYYPNKIFIEELDALFVGAKY